MSSPADVFAADSLLWALAKNAALLIALAYVHSLFPRTVGAARLPRFGREAGLGLILSLIGITVITAAYPFSTGVVFDTRSVLLGVTGLYFGSVTTVVVMLFTGLFRLWQGGEGALVGVTVIMASGLTGVFWRRLRKPDLARIGWAELWGFGLTVHVIMLGIFAALHDRLEPDTLALITVPVLGIYPVVTAVMGKLLSAPLQRAIIDRQMRDHDERLQLVIKGSNDGWWDWDFTTQKLTYSPRWWEMLGMKPDERPATPELWHALLHPDDVARVDARFKAALETGEENYEVEFRLRHRDGHWVSVISRGYIARDAAARPVRVSGTNTDITTLREAIDRATTARALLEAAGRIARIGYWEVSFAESRVLWSDITADIHDCPAGTQVSLERAVEFYPPEYRDKIDRDILALREEGRPYEAEYQIITAKGRRIWVQARAEPVRDAAGHITGMRGVFQDVDARHREAEARLQQERNYREIFNATTDAIFIHDIDSGSILDVNATMLAMYGFADKASALAATVADLSSGQPGYTEVEAAEHIRASLNGEPRQFTWQARRADGTVFWAEVVLRRSDIGGQNRILASVRDISRRLDLEERLREADKMESLGRLAGGIAHDFNNMLGVILGHTDLADLRLASGQSTRDDITQIRIAAKHSARLVRQLLSFARRETVVPRIIDLNCAIETALVMLRRLIGENITLEWRPAPDLWPVKIDPVQVDQIVTNLAINARDAIADTGTITIRTLNLHGEDNDDGADQVGLEISDSGTGMDHATLKRIFEPFFTTKAPGKGTGLGLASVYGIVEQNAGKITVESEPGRGTRFHIRLPRQVVETNANPAGKTPPATHVADGTETILLVEDEPAILQLGILILEHKGYTVIARSEPQAALDLAANAGQPIDLLVTDLLMPGMNGHTLYTRMRQLRPQLPALFVSGYSGDTLPADVFASGQVDFLGKPFSADELSGKVRALLDRR